MKPRPACRLILAAVGGIVAVVLLVLMGYRFIASIELFFFGFS